MPVKHVSTRNGPELHWLADAQGRLTRDTTECVLPLGGHPLLCYALTTLCKRTKTIRRCRIVRSETHTLSTRFSIQ